MVGPRTKPGARKAKGVAVRFPGSKGVFNCYLDQVCRPPPTPSHPQLPARPNCPSSQPTHDVWCMGAQVSRQPPPPLPGGYTVGEQVYFTGTSVTFEDGDQLEHGKQGEVVGPATAKSHKGKGVLVRFPGIKLGGIMTQCYLNSVRRRRRHAATTDPHHPSCPPTPVPLPYPYPRCVPCRRTGKPPAATAAAGRLHGRRAGLLHRDKSDLGGWRPARARQAGRGGGARD